MAQATASAKPTAPAAARLPVWSWEGKTRAGETKKGEMEAADENSVMQRLRQMQLQNVKVKKRPIQIVLTTSRFARCSPA